MGKEELNKAYLSTFMIIIVRKQLFILLFIFLFSIVSAYEIDIQTNSSVYAHESFNIKAYVTDESVPVSNPDCYIEFYLDDDLIQEDNMAAYEEYAQTIGSFSSEGSYEVNVSCYGVSKITNIEVISNSDSHLSVSGGNSLNDIAYLTMTYEDRYDSPINSADCSGSVYIDDDFFKSVTLYFIGSGTYSGNFIVDEVGDYRVSITCSASSYSDSRDIETFSLSAIPVSISISNPTLTGNFGDTVNTDITISPSTTICTSNYGTLTKKYSTRYSLSVPLDFIDIKSVIISCSAPEHLSHSKTISINSKKLNTQLEVKITPEIIYSFQLFSIYPNFYDVYGRPVYDASCIITADISSTDVKSFQGAVFGAPVGPSDLEVGIICSKFGYEQINKKFKLKIVPIPLYGTLQFPEKVKQEENFDFVMTLNPRINANCSLEGKINSRAGSVSQRISKKINLNGRGKIELQLNGSGTFEFEVSCSPTGYTVFKEEGEIEITLLSNDEEIKATLILTVLTIILAAGFMLIRKWL